MATSPMAALGRFGEDKERLVSVLEGKSTRDLVDRLFSGRRMSAVDQPYRYAILCHGYTPTPQRSAITLKEPTKLAAKTGRLTAFSFSGTI
jgi:hypothetical protein